MNGNQPGQPCGNCTEKPHDDAPEKLGPGITESIFRISGADCSDEVNAIKAALAKIGIGSVMVNLVASTATVHHPAHIDPIKIRAAIESTGVKVVDQEETSFVSANKRRVALVSSSGVLLGLGLLLEWTELLPKSALFGVFALATVLSGILVFPKAVRALLQKILDMNVLMSIAVIGAFAIGEFSEGATVVFLFSLAELLESFSVSRARNAIKAILKITPQVARVVKGDKILSLPVLEVALGDVIVIRPGDSFPLDGTVVEGVSSVNQAPLTGESVPVDKTTGDPVFAGTINENGALKVKVTKGFRDTKISRVLQLIEEAQQKKAPSEAFVDRFAKIYTPVVFVLAVGVASVPPLFGGGDPGIWFYRALVLLVIACPCALVLATPISVVSGLASLARRGVLVKGGKYLEALGKLKAVAMDKTGTLTEGKFRVQSFRNFSGANKNEVLRIALALERLSSHPLAKAVLVYGESLDILNAEARNFASIPGRGTEGWVDDCLYFAGNHKLAHELGVCGPEIEAHLAELEQQALSVVIVGHKPHGDHQGSVMGIFGLGDNLRQGAREAIQALHRVGISKVVVLSGDNQKTVDALCKLAGVDEGRGDLLPEDKVTEVKRLTGQFGHVAMVGDGVNDAPALASATIGVSMGAAGTDSAIETSDVSLMQDDLSQLSRAVAQGRRVLRVIQFNIGFAIVTKLVFLGLAVIGYSNLWLAVAADMGASILVTLNALRLLESPPSSYQSKG